MDLLDLRPVVDETTAAMWHAVDAATRPADHPADPVGEVLPRVRAAAGTGECTQLWVGVVGDRPVAAGELVLPSLDNDANAVVDVRVVADARRHGYGATLLGHLLDQARAAGRTRVFGEVQERLDGSGESAGVAFAQGNGARPVLTEVRRLLDLGALPAGRIETVRDDAWRHASGYALVQWVDRAPADLVDGVADLLGRMVTDAPMEEMAWDAEAYDAARVRARETDAIARGRRRIVTTARHETSGDLVAYTDIGVNVGRPRVGYQWDTIVRPDHRGHRLGLLIKAANLALLRETTPGVELVNTWNAEINRHMIAINETLGFRAVERERQWELLL